MPGFHNYVSHAIFRKWNSLALEAWMLTSYFRFSKSSCAKFFWHQNSLKNGICKHWGKVKRQQEVNQSKEEASDPRLCPGM